MTHSKDVFFCRQIEMRKATKIKKAKNASLSKGLVLYIRVSFVIKFRGLLHYDKIIINTISILYQICFFSLQVFVLDEKQPLNDININTIFEFNIKLLSIE